MKINSDIQIDHMNRSASEHIRQTHQRGLGIVCILVSAAAFGAMAIFANFAYAGGADPVTLLFLRFVLAGGVMWIFIRIKKIPFPRGRALLISVLMGAAGYAGQSFSFFTALLYASSGTVAILLYLHPAMVTLLSALGGRKIIPAEVAALVLALGGTVFVIGFEISGRPLGIGLALLAAMIYSVYIMVGARVMPRVDVRASSTVIMLSAGAVYSGAVLFNGVHLPSGVSGWAAVAGIVLISTVLAIVTFFEGLKRVGPVHATMLSTLEPVVTVVLAWMVFSDRLTVLQIMGAGMILGAGLLLSRQPAPGKKIN